MPGCEPGVVAAGPRDQMPSGGFEPPASTMSGWRAHRCSTRTESSRQESNLPEPAYQTGAWPLGHSWKRPVRGLNPSHPVDSRAGTPASSQGGKDGRIRTLSARVGAALLSQEHILILVVWRASRRKPDVDNVQHGGLTLRRSPSTPTRTRTRNPSFEARDDFRFTIGVFPSRKRKRGS